MVLKVMLDVDDLEDDAGFCDFEGDAGILTILKMMLEFDDFEDDAGF